jgi:hypothetical protein
MNDSHSDAQAFPQRQQPEPPRERRWQKTLAMAISSLLLLVAVALWVEGVLHSPLVDEKLAIEQAYIAAHISANARSDEEERLLAQGYWRRYRDVRLDRHWGENGPMGIHGPRDHYRQHGRREGRIFKPLVSAEDLAAERILAESYWRRHPEVRNSWIWGEHADLGVLGPRDHFIHVGSGLGYQWGPGEPENQLTNQTSGKQP